MKTIFKNYLSINKISVFVMLVFFAISAKTQVNLVQNPSFEEYHACPYNTNHLSFAKYWFNLQDSTGCNPWFMHTCANGGSTVISVGVPVNGGGNSFSYQQAHAGLGYAALRTYVRTEPFSNISNRDYIQNELKQPLKSNTNYCVTAHLSLVDYSQGATNIMGAYFDNGNLSTSDCLVANVTPQMEYISPTIWADTQNWVKVQGSFTATGGETYMTLGNFRNNANTNYQELISPGNGYWTANYYIDDISLIESDLPAFAGNDTALQNVGDSLYLGRPAEIGLECIWYNWSGDSIGTGAGIWVTPSHTQPYIVEQNLCGNIKRDTVYVSVGTSIEDAGDLQGIKVYPNPCEGTFTIQSKTFERFSTVEITIAELSSKTVYSEVAATQAEMPIATKLPSGMYFLHVQDIATDKKMVRRLLIQ